MRDIATRSCPGGWCFQGLVGRRHRTTWFSRVFLALSSLAITAHSLPAEALEPCAAKLRRGDGVVVVSTSPRETVLSWSSAENPTKTEIPEASCTAKGDRVDCLLSDPAEMPPPSPPSDCIVLLSDGTSDCTAYVKGCVRGERRVVKCLKVSDDGEQVVYEGCNVHIRNPSGSTAAVDGTGNLIIGWNEALNNSDRGGSHNLVIGSLHSWNSYGGLVGGRANSISAPYSTIVGGAGNVANGIGSAILGGAGNVASGKYASISGGHQGFASGNTSSVAGGDQNAAVGESSFAGGGGANAATGENAAVVGGSGGEASGLAALVSGGIANLAIGKESTVLGGQDNLAGDEQTFASTVVGGRSNTATDNGSLVSGGSSNVASAGHSAVSGGTENQATAAFSSVSGGLGRSATGFADWVAGSLLEDE